MNAVWFSTSKQTFVKESCMRDIQDILCGGVQGAFEIGLVANVGVFRVVELWKGVRLMVG